MIQFLALIALAQYRAPAPAYTPPPPSKQEGRLGPTEAYQRCMATGDAARGILSAIQVCVGSEMALQEDRLAYSYDRAMNRFGWAGQFKLQRMQWAWRDYTKVQCSERAAHDTRGNQSVAIYELCMLDETIARAGWLDTYSPETAG